MGQLAKYSPARGRWIAHSPRPSRRRSQFPDPQGKRFSLSQTADDSQWEEIKCEAKAEISEGYRSAIALLRSLRNVTETEAQEKRESWKLLTEALDEDRFH